MSAQAQMMADLHSYLVAAVSALGGRVHSLRLPQGPTYPCALLQIVSSDVAQAHDGPSAIEDLRLQVDLAATVDQGAALFAARDALVDAMHALRQSVEGSTLFGFAHLDGERDLSAATGELLRRTLDFQLSYQPST